MHRVFGSASMMLLCAALPASVAAQSASAAIHVRTTTYAQRVAACALRQPAQVREIALPLACMSAYVPQPFPVAIGDVPQSPYPDPTAVVWRRIPVTAGVEAWLARRAQTATGADPLRMVDWCEQQGLPDCAAYELRCAMQPIFTQVQSPAYQRLNSRWWKHAQRGIVPWVFPLPVAGTWKVAPDVTGHHRQKSGATFAVDLVVEENGRTFTGLGRSHADYFAWRREVLAQADGVVMVAEGMHPDLPIGTAGRADQVNVVIVDYGAGVRGLYAHLAQGSLRVKVGQQIAAGSVLGLVGNSGMSIVPHLHVSFVDNDHISIRGRYAIEVLDRGRFSFAADCELADGMIARNPGSASTAP